NIAVNKTFIMCIADTAQYLFNYLEGIVDAKSAVFQQIIFNSSSFNEFHYKTKKTSGFHKAVHRNNIGMRKFSLAFCFSFKSLNKMSVLCLILFQYFYCYIPVEFKIERFIHRTHSPFPYQ